MLDPILLQLQVTTFGSLMDMGWNGSYNGWYYIDTTLSFETGNGDYDTDFWYISKLRKK